MLFKVHFTSQQLFNSLWRLTSFTPTFQMIKKKKHVKIVIDAASLEKVKWELTDFL